MRPVPSCGTHTFPYCRQRAVEYEACEKSNDGPCSGPRLLRIPIGKGLADAVCKCAAKRRRVEQERSPKENTREDAGSASGHGIDRRQRGSERTLRARASCIT
jgi:hypothetical protein